MKSPDDRHPDRGKPPVFDPADLARWCGGSWNARPRALHGVSHDTRTLERGALYVALAGERFDGHRFVPKAFEAGAAGAMVRKDHDSPGAVLPLLRVPDTTTALGAMASGYRRALAPHLVGVTGSVGKTTVTAWTACLLAEQMPTASTRRNFNNHIGLPLSLLAMSADARQGVFEIGMNHPGELKFLCDILAPDAAIVTSIGPVHLEFFPSVEAIADEKAALLRALPSRGFAVLDRDSPYHDFLARQTDARLVTVSLEGRSADFQALEIDDVAGTFVFHERDTGCRERMRIPLPGRHQVLNAMLAIATARVRGVPLPTIRHTLPRLPSMTMRWQSHTFDGATVINDAYNANPPAVAAALRTFAALHKGSRRILVLGEMRELGEAARQCHEAIGAEVARGGGEILIVVARPGAWIAEAAQRHGYQGRVFTATDATDAGTILARILRPGDHVLLKASRGVALERALDILKPRVRGDTRPGK